jgi:hypothetical protein
VGSDTALIIHDFDRLVRVHGYDESVGEARECRTVSAVVAYVHPETGEEYMLVIHQAILIPQLSANLLSPMQLRDNDIRVNDEPKFMVPNPTDDHNAIVVPPQEGEDEPFRIPLSLTGVTTYFPTTKPTRQQWESIPLERQIELTYESPEWDPATDRFKDQEATMLDMSGRLRDGPMDWSPKRVVAALHSIP